MCGVFIQLKVIHDTVLKVFDKQRMRRRGPSVSPALLQIAENGHGKLFSLSVSGVGNYTPTLAPLSPSNMHGGHTNY